MINPEIIGYTAGVLISITMTPQLIKSIKTESINDVSLGMLILFFSSMLLWFSYGILIENKPLIIFNGISSIISGIQLFIKIKYENKKNA